MNITDTQRLKAVENFTKLTTNALSKAIGLKNAQTLYDIHKGKHGISKEIAGKITAKYLDIDLAWLLTGEGEMLHTEQKNETTIKNNTGITMHTSGDSQKVTNVHKVTSDTTVDVNALISEMAEQRNAYMTEIKEQRNAYTDQINRLLTLLENK